MQPQKLLNLNSLISQARPHAYELIAGSAAMLIYVVCWPLLAWLAGQLIPAIGAGNLNLVINVIIKALIVFLIQKVAQFSQDIFFAKPSLAISQNLRTELFRKLQRIKLTSLQKLSSGDITYRLTEDADRVGEVIYKTIQDTTPSLLQLIAVLIYMVYLDWQISLATLILAPLITILIGKFGEKVMMTAEKSQQKVSDLASLLSEAIQGLPLIRAFAVEGWMQARFDDQVEEHRRARFRTLKLLALQHPVIGFIEAAGILTVLALGASRIQSGALNSQEFSSYFAALLMLIDPISHLTTNFNELQQGQASLRRLQEIQLEPVDQLNDITDYINTKGSGEIEFSNITFKYQKDNKVIRNLSLKINAGEIIAFVGPSGGGKSTLFSLLLGFIQAQEGYIYINGNEISRIHPTSLRKQIGLVPQVGSIFSGTIMEAIRFGRNISEEKVINSAKLANAHDFISNLKNGYSTFLEERGTNLSGGQLQRLSIARALVGDPSILLLDEATSALDANSEKEVQLGLHQAMKNRTVIIIAHRLSTVQGANKIVYIENGEISEIGTHQQLINNSGKYSALCENQFIKGQIINN